MNRFSVLGLATLIPLLGWPGAGLAKADSGIQLRLIAEQEVEAVDEHGAKTFKRIQPTRVVPGDEVIYTIRYRNNGNTPADHVAITNPIPEHMTYVDGSAHGDGADITYSVDGGKRFDVAAKLRVTTSDGKRRAATADDYSHIRWTFRTAMAPVKEGAVGYRARLH